MVDFTKGNGLVPVIIQHKDTLEVLMLGYMNQEAYEQTKEEKLVTFYSRSKRRLWTKGETSENYLHVSSIKLDCDNDTLLIKVRPDGPVCHTGSRTCFSDEKPEGFGFLALLENVIASRKTADPGSSYTADLYAAGVKKIAQKVGEEAVELVLEAQDSKDDLFLGEAADLLYHFTVLLQAKGQSWRDVITTLSNRHNSGK